MPSRSGQICLSLVAITGCATDPAEQECEARVLRITSAVVPHNNATAREHGLDLDGDKTVDNQLGLVAGTLNSQLGFDLDNAFNTRLASGLVWQIGVATCDDATARIERGVAMPLGAMFDPNPSSQFGAGWTEPRIAEIELAPLADGATWTGRLGMAFPPEGVTEAIVPPIVAYMNEYDLYIDEFDDAPKDGQISVEEMAESNLVKSLLAPDLDRGISFGVSFSASEAPAN